MSPAFSRRPHVHFSGFGFLLCLALLAQWQLSAAAQDEDTALSVDTPTLSTPGPTMRPFRVVILTVGGVSWREWSRLGVATSTATPNLRRVLEEGGLGAAWLPGSVQRPGEFARIGQKDAPVSPAMLQAAAILSAGQTLAPGTALHPSLAQTLGIAEVLSQDVQGWEASSAALAFARRTDRAPAVGNLVNLGWGTLAQQLENSQRESELQRVGVLAARPVGTLGAIIHSAGRKTAAVGNGESSIDAASGARLRESALAVVDESGVIDSGEVSAAVLARDKDAPFGVRANATAMLQAMDTAFDEQAALVSVEWGDTRRAARYAPFCVPEVAAAHQQVALQRLDSFVGDILVRLNDPRDRLFVVSVSDLQSNQSQLLPVVFWRPQRGGQGALLTTARSETVGLIGLENLHAKIVAQLGAEQNLPIVSGAFPIDEVGEPSSSLNRIRKLQALGSGLEWLSQARPMAHGLWCALFIGACFFSLWALNLPSERLKLNARVLWSATMIFPWLLWLAGLCVETTWRFGVSNSATWQLPLALVLLACLMWFLIGATFNWFSRTRLLSTRIAVAWLLLTLFALWLGSFALPLNALLQRAAVEATLPVPRAGDVWALLLISATLLGLAGLTRANSSAIRSGVARNATAPNAGRPREEEVESDERRAINLRPALIWAVATVALLWASNWGANPMAAFLAFVALGAMYLRLWLERATREHRLRVRRFAVAIVAAVGVLLLWQRGGSTLFSNSLVTWWPQWLAAWGDAWWLAAFFATLILALGSLLPRSRLVLRAYLHSRFSRRAMLGAATLTAVVGVVVMGPSAAPLIATFTLGAIMYEALR